MKQDRGELANRWAGIGNTALFFVALLVMIYLAATGRYLFCLNVVGIGIYAELWNMRVSKRLDHGEDQ